jgi:hypothetical protein
MERFLSVLCEDDYQALVMEGQPPENELRIAWLKFLEQFSELKGNTPGDDIWMLKRDINRLQNHLDLVAFCVDFLTRDYSKSIAASLRRLGYSFNPKTENPVEYLPQLERVATLSRTHFIMLQQLKKQLEEKSAKLSENKEKPARQYYEDLLVAIEEMNGVAYNFETLTVTKYLSLERKYWQVQEKLNNKK